MDTAPEEEILTFDAVEEARRRIASEIYTTPLPRARKLSAVTGSDVFLKLENLQHTGSFKERGALNKLLTLSHAERSRGVVAASAGNHAQGLAYHAQRQGVKATIVMPCGTPLIKVSRTQSFGAEVVLHGDSYDEAYQHALTLQEERDLTFVHPFNDLAVMAGQGTLGLELLEQNPYLEMVVLPVGGGGLISGVAVALKETNPRIKVVGVETSVIPAMQNALYRGELVTTPTARTIADGIAVQRVGSYTLNTVRRYVDEIVTVDEEDVANAILLLLEQEKTVAEGAAAVTLAALRAGNIPSARGRRVALVISGGNIDVNVISRIIERGLVRDGRLMSASLTLDDAPGALARLTGLLAQMSVNIIEIHHNRAVARLGETGLQMTLETRGFEHIDRIRRRLIDEGYHLHMEAPDRGAP